MRCPYKESAYITFLGRNAPDKELDYLAKCQEENCGKYRSCFNLEIMKAVPVEMKVDVEKIIKKTEPDILPAMTKEEEEKRREETLKFLKPKKVKGEREGKTEESYADKLGIKVDNL